MSVRLCVTASVRWVRKKWLSPFCSTYWCYIHQTCINCSSWHDLLMPRGGLCPWPTFHAWVTKTQNGNSRAPVMVPITIMSSLVSSRLYIEKYGFLALLVETSRAYAIPLCMSVRLSVRLSVCKQFLLPHLLWGFLSQRLLYSPSLLALWCSCAPAIIIMILSPGA